MLNAVPELLTEQNLNGETPLFRAVQFGQTKMFKHVMNKHFTDSLNKKIHCRRADNATILHVAIFNESFETALELLNVDLVKHQAVDGCGLTCLQLLANMPLAFKSGTSFGFFKKLVYYCLPDCKRDEPPKSYNVTRDEEAGTSEFTLATLTFPARVISHLRIFSSMLNHKFWYRLSQGWPAIQVVWDLRQKHKSALELVNILVQTDKSWMGPSKHHGMHPEGDVSIFRN
ncbi:hypothetical protein AQUCO_03200076v1, partial [Aquilegia coerulea]